MNVTTLLKKYNLSPKKGLGQNFLADAFHLEQIVAAAELTAADTVIEIGPGLGTLTERLAGQAGRVIAVELDSQMVNLLRTEYAHLPNLTVVQADILQTRLADLLPGGQPQAYKVVANLPYYITSAVIRHLLESAPQPQRVVVTIQREVAERIVAQPGDMSVLAVSVQFYGQAALVHHLPAAAFYPAPKVDSAVVRIDTYPEPPLVVPDIEQFFRVVKAGFGQKRKQLKNSLAAGLRLSAGEVAAGLQAADIDATRRAQTLTLAEWGRLAAEMAQP
jgi:16S rRNA (adenine1518-N6/adenine1519-N6)-dimethyltransferase